MSNKKTQEVAAKEPTHLAAVPQAPAQSQDILSSDIIIPWLLLMQDTSDAVKEKKKTPEGVRIESGDFVRSGVFTKLGDATAPVQFIPLKIEMGWNLEEKVGNKFEYRKRESRNANNENLPWSFFRNAQGAEFNHNAPGTTEWRRVKTMGVYSLLVKDLVDFRKEMESQLSEGGIPDLNKTVLPVMIGFRSTGYQAGKAVATFFARVQDAMKAYPSLRPYHYSLELGAHYESNDKGDYHVMDVSGKTAKVPVEVVGEAARWYEILNTRKDIRVETLEEESTAIPAEGSSIC